MLSGFGRQYSIPSVEPDDLRRVLQILYKTKTGELKENIAIAIGRAIKTDSDSNAILARAPMK